MEDLCTQTPAPEFTVSQISFEIKRFVETAFRQVRVKGEIFGAKQADSGHWYLSLKDENAVLAAVIWKGTAAHLPIKPEDGLEIIATGKITTFAGKSSYQLVIEKLEAAGAGALLKLLEERKQKFAAEGLFDESHKKNLPFLPQTIGVITSASGAIIRDIIHRVRDRFPSHIILWPTPVQGEGAAEKIAEAVRGFNDFPKDGLPRPDILIVARGGGSLEDLWPFNEEVVIRAVYNSQIPIISAVGHETDTMLIDYVSDKRAPTPTGAAEFAVPVRRELQIQINSIENRLLNGVNRYIGEQKLKLDSLNRGIPNLEQILQESQQKFDERWERLHLAFTNFLILCHHHLQLAELKPSVMQNIFEKNQENLNNLMHRLEAVSIDSVLRRGFAWIQNDKKKTISSFEQARRESRLTINFHDGNLKTTVTGKRNDLQGDLFDM